MAPLRLYYSELSPPSRAVLLVLKGLDLEVEHRHVNFITGEQFEPTYLKLNPQHTVPTLEEGDFVVWDSHAINVYLLSKYGTEEPLYPKDLQKRAVVDQRLHFDNGILFPTLIAIARPILSEGAKSIPKEKSNAVTNAYNFLETFLQGKQFAAGDTITLADYSLATTASQLNQIIPITSSKYPEITRWLGNVREEVPFFDEIDTPSVDRFGKLFKSKLN